jgi:hypothetical protein
MIAVIMFEKKKDPDVAPPSRNGIEKSSSDVRKRDATPS